MTDDEIRQSCGPPSFWFTVAGIRGGRFEGRPLDRPPSDKTFGFLYAEIEPGSVRQVGPAVFTNGAWKRLNKAKAPEASHWVVLVNAGD